MWPSDGLDLDDARHGLSESAFDPLLEGEHRNRAGLTGSHQAHGHHARGLIEAEQLDIAPIRLDGRPDPVEDLLNHVGNRHANPSVPRGVAPWKPTTKLPERLKWSQLMEGRPRPVRDGRRQPSRGGRRQLREVPGKARFRRSRREGRDCGSLPTPDAERSEKPGRFPALFSSRGQADNPPHANRRVPP